MVALSPKFDPPILKGIKVDPRNPFKFDFILDKGSLETPLTASLQKESERLIKYFLATLTTPEKDLWVNLSPYEKDRVVPQSFGQTEMGRDLLAEDYMLKQITASLMYPEGGVGRKFWKRIYDEASKKYGTTGIPLNTFNKVWIIPDKAVVYENAKTGTAYVVKTKLKVMLEEDYLSFQKHAAPLPSLIHNDIASIGANIVREIVIPELTREVNENKSFAQLRQIYSSLILATWFKKKIKDSLLVQVYADQKKVAGVEYGNSVIAGNEAAKQFFPGSDTARIYRRYLQAFKKGVYNYIKEEDSVDAQGRMTGVPRKYFSGGTSFDAAMMGKALSFTKDETVLSGLSSGHLELINVRLDMAMNAHQWAANPDGGEQALGEFIKLRLGENSDSQELTREFLTLREKFYPWVIKKLDDLQKQNRPLRIKVILRVEGGAGQEGKLALLLMGLKSIHENIEFKVEFQNTWGYEKSFFLSRYDYTYLTHEIPHLELGESGKFRSYPADMVIGINTETNESRGRSIVIGVLAKNHGRSALSGVLDENDLSSPLGTIIFDPTLKKMRQEEDRDDRIDQRVGRRQKWLEKHLDPDELRLLSKDASKGIWTFAHTSALTSEVRDLLDTDKRKGGKAFDKYCAGKKQVIIFSSDKAEDPKVFTSMGAAVIQDGIIYTPSVPAPLPVTIIIKNFPNQYVRELIGFHTGTLKRSKDNQFWINFPLYITGNASWMEAISAGALWRHDNVDAGVTKFADISKLIERKHAANADSLDTAKRFVSGNSENFYEDLEYWTIWAKEFSELMGRGYNRLCDILGVAVYNATHVLPQTLIDGLNDPAHNFITARNGEKFILRAYQDRPGSNWVKVDLQGQALDKSDDGFYPNAMSFAVFDDGLRTSIELDHSYKWTDGTPMGRDLRKIGMGTALYKALIDVLPPGAVINEKIDNEETRQRILENVQNPTAPDEALIYKGKRIVDIDSQKADEITVEQLISETVIGKLFVRSGLVHLRFIYNGLQGTGAMRRFMDDQRQGLKRITFNFGAVKPDHAMSTLLQVQLPVQTVFRLRALKASEESGSANETLRSRLFLVWSLIKDGFADRNGPDVMIYKLGESALVGRARLLNGQKVIDIHIDSRSAKEVKGMISWVSSEAVKNKLKDQGYSSIIIDTPNGFILAALRRKGFQNENIPWFDALLAAANYHHGVKSELYPPYDLRGVRRLVLPLNRPQTDTGGAAVLAKDHLGGIDLTSAHLNVRAQNEGRGIMFHLDPAVLRQLQNAPGFTPVIIRIQPLKDLRIFLGINDSLGVDKSV